MQSFLKENLYTSAGIKGRIKGRKQKKKFSLEKSIVEGVNISKIGTVHDIPSCSLFGNRSRYILM